MASRTGPSPARISIASAPCPAAGHIRSTGMTCRSSSVRPSLRSPAAARMMPSYSPDSSLRRRVSTFPRSGCTVNSGLMALSCASRRKLLVPTRAPFGESSIEEYFTEQKASRGSSRTGTAAIVNCSDSSVGKSFRLCTARSMWFSARASSISFINIPFEPTLARATSVILSPVV